MTRQDLVDFGQVLPYLGQFLSDFGDVPDRPQQGDSGEANGDGCSELAVVHVVLPGFGAVLDTGTEVSIAEFLSAVRMCAGRQS